MNTYMKNKFSWRFFFSVYISELVFLSEVPPAIQPNTQMEISVFDTTAGKIVLVYIN